MNLFIVDPKHISYLYRICFKAPIMNVSSTEIVRFFIYLMATPLIIWLAVNRELLLPYLFAVGLPMFAFGHGSKLFNTPVKKRIWLLLSSSILGGMIVGGLALQNSDILIWIAFLITSIMLALADLFYCWYFNWFQYTDAEQKAQYGSYWSFVPPGGYEKKSANNVRSD